VSGEEWHSRGRFLDHLEWRSLRFLPGHDVDYGLGVVHFGIAGRIPSRRGEEIQEFLKNLGLAIGMANERDVREISVDLVSADSEGIPEIFKALDSQEFPEFRVILRRCRLGPLSRELKQRSWHPQLEDLMPYYDASTRTAFSLMFRDHPGRPGGLSRELDGPHGDHPEQYKFATALDQSPRISPGDDDLPAALPTFPMLLETPHGQLSCWGTRSALQ
jgi:hypothetical protein